MCCMIEGPKPKPFHFPCDSGLWYWLYHPTHVDPTSPVGPSTCTINSSTLPPTDIVDLPPCYSMPPLPNHYHMDSTSSWHHGTKNYPNFLKFHFFLKTHNFKKFPGPPWDPEIIFSLAILSPYASNSLMHTKCGIPILNSQPISLQNWGFSQCHPILHGYTIIFRIAANGKLNKCIFRD